MIAAIILAQTVPLPSSREALLWVIVTVLAGVVAYLYRQVRKDREGDIQFRTEMLEKTLAGLGENSQAMREVATALSSLEENFSLRQEIENLRREFSDGKKKD